MKRQKQKYFFYILKCKDRSLYCGIAKDLKIREKAHNSGKGSIYVRTHGGGRIKYFETYKKIGQALSREAEVKKWPRSKKLKLLK